MFDFDKDQYIAEEWKKYSEKSKTIDALVKHLVELARLHHSVSRANVTTQDHKNKIDSLIVQISGANRDIRHAIDRFDEKEQERLDRLKNENIISQMRNDDRLLNRRTFLLTCISVATAVLVTIISVLDYMQKLNETSSIDSRITKIEAHFEKANVIRDSK